MRPVELLSPAGNLEKCKTALYFGADAVYAGGPVFNLRAGSANFSLTELRQAVDDADPAAESSGDQQSVGLGLAGGRRHDTGEFFRGDLKVHLRLQSCPDDG